MNNKNKAQTLEETARAVERMADRLEEMDKADGVFGETLEDEDLDEVAGGVGTIIVVKQPTRVEVSRPNIIPPPGY